MIGGASITATDIVLHLSDGHYMVNHVTDSMIAMMWHSMSDPQKEEFEILYGEGKGFDGMKEEIRSSDHAVAFFCGLQLTCIMWAQWQDQEGIKEHARTLGCVCSDFALKHTVNFVKHSKECRDAFMLTEPKEVDEIYVFITEHFKSSREWAVRVCGLKEVCKATANGGHFVCYKHVVGEG